MSQVTVAPHALDSYVRAERTAAAVVGDHARTHRGEVGALAGTFGVIGAEFLAATTYVLDAHARTLDALAARHNDQATHTRDAATTYRTGDAGAGAVIGSTRGDQELRL
ncbi:type VII secretion target [Gordonia sp. CPCC 205515]|uniref:type VII secretion target n=1 Tax=Gordonia sp. CPCC 205515 TaxID=3140791 RepID=UPI003AF3AEA2